jgi:hypothetical protein
VGKPKNKSSKSGVFLQAQKPSHKTPHHHAFHHQFTTFLPPKNTTKSQNPHQKLPFLTPKYFSAKTSPHLTFFAIKPIRKLGTSHDASEVVLP